MTDDMTKANRSRMGEQTRLVFDVPTGQRATRQVLQAAADAVAEETNTRVEISDRGRKVTVNTNEREPIHDVIDVAESVLQNELGDGSAHDDFSVRKSLLRAEGTRSQTPQPCFEPSGGFSRGGLARAGELFNLVAAPSGSVEQVGGRIYYDTPGQSISHVQLDVAEIITRRVAAVEGVTVPRFHTVQVRDPHA